MANNQDQILIAVLGVTGAGKSTFINRACGEEKVVVGHTSLSCTQEIAYANCVVDGKLVTLIDTPGFDDSERTDADILDGIATWLELTYKKGMLLTGIILLQPVTTNRYTGSEGRRTRLFKKICGTDAYGNVVIGTTMWSQLSNASQGHSRVRERKDSFDFWGDMVKHGSRIVNHEDNKGSAHNIIRILLRKQKKPLQMQEELADNDGYLYGTSAAQQLHEDLGQTSEKESQRLRELHRELQLSRDDRAQLMKEVAELKKKLEDFQGQRMHIETQRYCSDNRSGPAWLTALAAMGTAGVTAVAVTAPLLCAIM